MSITDEIIMDEAMNRKVKIQFVGSNLFVEGIIVNYDEYNLQVERSGQGTVVVPRGVAIITLATEDEKKTERSKNSMLSAGVH